MTNIDASAEHTVAIAAEDVHRTMAVMMSGAPFALDLMVHTIVDAADADRFVAHRHFMDDQGRTTRTRTEIGRTALERAVADGRAMILLMRSGEDRRRSNANPAGERRATTRLERIGSTMPPQVREAIVEAASAHLDGSKGSVSAAHAHACALIADRSSGTERLPSAQTVWRTVRALRSVAGGAGCHAQERA